MSKVPPGYVQVGDFEAGMFGIQPGSMLEIWRYMMLRDIYDPGSYAAVLSEMGDGSVLDGLDMWAAIHRRASVLVEFDAVELVEGEAERMRQICVAEAVKRGLPLLVDLPSPETRH